VADGLQGLLVIAARDYHILGTVGQHLPFARLVPDAGHQPMAQALAVAGMEIKYAASENGTYSTAIPTGTNAGDYPVWYKVEVTDNYTAVGPSEIRT